MNTDSKEVAISALKALALATVLLAAFMYLFSWLGRGQGIDTAPPANLAPTTTSEGPPTTTTLPPLRLDPSVGRPVFTEFSLLLLYDDQLHSTCAESYQNDTAACYDAFKRGTDEFEATVKNALQAHMRASVEGSRGYASNQYGCHDDGRCLDEMDEWCWESEVGYVEGFGLACPGTVDWFSDRAEEDLYRRQMEEDRP